MEFKMTYKTNKAGNIIKPLYFINGKKVSKKDFDKAIRSYWIEDLKFNLTKKNDTYEATFLKL